MSERLNSKAIYLPELEEPMTTTARQTQTFRVIAAWINHKDTGNGGRRKMQWAIVLIAVLVAFSAASKP